MPSGWDVVGMGVVDSLTQLAVSAGNAAISLFTLKSQIVTAGLGALMGKYGDKTPQIPTAPVNSSPNGISTLPNNKSLTDPALMETPKVLQLAYAIQQLLSGGRDGKPDWDKIRAKDPVCRLQSLTNCASDSRSYSSVGVAQPLSSSLYNLPRETWTQARSYPDNLMYTSTQVSASSIPSLR
jgi:hypothetical protein